jgi:hypothetical protein
MKQHQKTLKTLNYIGFIGSENKINILLLQ